MYYEPYTQTEYESIQAFRLAHQHTSFGELDTEAERNAIGLYTIEAVYPEFDRDLQTATPLGVAQIDGKWCRVFSVADKPLDPAAKDAIIARRYEDALTAHLDATAQSKRYDNRITCALRAGYSGPFQAEGAAFAAWMDQCNALGYQMLAEIQAGTRPMFSDTAAFIAEMPAMVWPS